MEFFQFTKEEFCFYGLNMCLLPIAILAVTERKGIPTDDMAKELLNPKCTSDMGTFLRCAAKQAGIKGAY
jgi:hypothetical protein